MKKLLFVAAFLSSMSAFADNTVTLTSGGSITLNGMTVQCGGAANEKANCYCRMDGGKWTAIAQYANGTSAMLGSGFTYHAECDMAWSGNGLCK